jgi:hypothetical protein
MNRMQRIARFNLKVVGAGASLSLLVILISLITESSALTYLGFFILGIAALIAGLSRLIVGKEPGRISFDERDAAIEKKAYLSGYCLLWCAFILTCMIAIPGLGAAILVVTLVVIKTIESLAVLIQYGRGSEDGA